MAKSYEDFDDDDHEDEDEDIGALGSILSWDEDEDGAVGGSSSTDRESSALPELVSFNMKGGGLSSLQQLQAAGDASNMNLPMPTPFNFGQQQVNQLQNSQSAPQHKHGRKGGSKSPQPLAPNAQANGMSLTQQQIQQLQHRQMQQQYQMHQQQQQQQQQQQRQPQHQSQQQLLPTTQQQQQQQVHQVHQAIAPAPPAPQATAQQQQQAAQAQQAAQQAAAAVQQGAFQLFQQGALLAQSQQNSKQQPIVPTMMMPNVSQNTQDAQNQAQQFAFAADPAAFLRQLQVAQLQQQFNAVQQGRSMAQQVVVPAAQAPQPVMQQQIQYQGQVAAVALPPPVIPPAAPPVPKRSRAASKKSPQTSRATSALAASKAVVSASDTDGESKVITKASRKAAAAAAASADSGDDQESLPMSREASEVDLSHLSPEERAKANRDRNREHARNTRLRKKAYLEKLKSTVDELCRERDTLVSERAGAANILVEMHNTRTEVLMSFFALRSANEKRRELWSSILEESCFACVMPVTPYRSFPASEVQVSKCQRTILGIDGMMSDTASLHVLLNSLVDRSRFPNATIVFRYTLVTEEAVVAGNQMMARWVMSTLNATQCGARMEIAKQGMLCCKFNSAHKIIGLELMFDVMALMLQLKQAAGSDTFSVIPNTVQTCQRSFDKPMVMTLAEEPYTIVQVNKLWEEMTGYRAEDVVGKASCRILEGEETEASAVEGLMNEIRFKRPASAMIVRYRKDGERFRDFFLSYPLSTDSRITHYLFVSNHVDSSPSLLAGSKQDELNGLQRQISVGAPKVPTQSSQAFFGIQALPGSQAVMPQATQPMFSLPAVLSNPLASVQGQLPHDMAGAGAMLKFPVAGLKRPHDGADNGQPSKQNKASEQGGN